MTTPQQHSSKAAVGYWLFQSNLRWLRLREALRTDALQTFPVRAHHKKIRPGDRVMIWQTGRYRGCYALAVVTSPPEQRMPAEEELPFYHKEVETEWRVSLHIEYNLWDRPIDLEVMDDDPAFADFHAGLSGTNYRATIEQYQAMVNLVEQWNVLHEPEPEYAIDPGYFPPLNLILYGPPGTGKTYQTIERAVAIIENRTLAEIGIEGRKRIKKRYDAYQDTGRIDFVTFHQSFSYEDFIEGIKPAVVDGQVTYRIEDGIFKRLCERARKAAAAERYVLIIDEINRGNLPAIFGELISLIEPNKRAGCSEMLRTVLPYSKSTFSVPANVYLLGTMNSADRSTESLDVALRRRFSFHEVPSDHRLIPKLARAPMAAGVDLARLLHTINERLEDLLDEQARIGHAYFLNVLDLDDLRAVFDLHILPLLKAYFFHDISRIGLVLGRAFVISGDEEKEIGLADFDHPFGNEVRHRHRFRLRPVEELEEADFIRVYDPDYPDS